MAFEQYSANRGMRYDPLVAASVSEGIESIVHFDAEPTPNQFSVLVALRANGAAGG